MSEGLRDRIKATADANGRSQNSEIVSTLEEAYPAPAPSHIDMVDWVSYVHEAANLAEVRKRIEEANRAISGAGGDFLLELETAANGKGHYVQIVFPFGFEAEEGVETGAPDYVMTDSKTGEIDWADDDR